MFLGQIKTESVLEVFHNTFYIGLGSPCKDIIVSLRLFYTLKISSQEVLWIRHPVDSETLFSDEFKHMIRFLIYNNQVIAVAGHIRPLFYDRCLGFFRISQEIRVHENQTKHIQSEQTYSIFTIFRLAYARINRIGVNSVLLCLSSIHCTPSQFAPTSLFDSTTATNIVRRHQQIP